jgi:riboflavin kinase/FMN adenylyltransferase
MFCHRSKIDSTIKHSIVAIGNFDGVHLGHQKLLEEVRNISCENKFTSVLLTFEPYPQEFFCPDNLIPRLTSLREKINFIKKININYIYALPFNQSLSLYSPEQFIEEILINKLNAKYIVVGEDFRFGYQRKGDIKLLASFLNTKIISPVMLENERISSSLIRQKLSNGNLESAQKLLGRRYSLIGRVVHGDQRGRTLGFPTANISLKKRIPPLKGVFAVRVNGEYLGIANLGTRPTVDGKSLFLEVHLFDFNKDIYGQYLEVEFIQKIRDEMRFDSLDQLKKQIEDDVSQVRKILYPS